MSQNVHSITFYDGKLFENHLKSKISRCDLVTIYSMYLANIVKRILKDQP